MPRASPRISRMIMSAARSAPVAAAKLNSIARHVLSRPTLSRLPYAVLQAARLNMLPRNPCRIVPAGKPWESLATSGGKSWRCGLRQQRRRLAASGDTEQSKSIASGLFSGQKTRVHPPPAPALGLPRASRRGRATPLLFFDPRRDCVTRDAKSARQPAQTAAFVVGAQDLFALLFGVGIRARLFSTALTARAAQVTLSAIGS